MSKPKTSLLIASALAALGISTGTYVARQIVMVSPPPIMPANPSEPGGGGDELIPEERMVTWTPSTHTGVSGGIPTNRTQCVTTECAAVTSAASGYKDGTLDAAALLQAAMTSATANTYVLIPAGTWKIQSTIGFGQADDNVTLRGTTRDTTIIDCRVGASVCINTGTDDPWNWPSASNEVTGYATSGANTVLTLTSAADIGGTGTMVRLSVGHDAVASEPIFSIAGFNLSNSRPIRKQITQVVSKTATTVTVFPPIHGMDQIVGLDAKLHTMQFDNTGFGIEDLTVDANLSGSANVFAGIAMGWTMNSWIKNVKVVRALNYTIKLESSMRIEIRDVELGHLAGGGSNGAGLLMNTVSSSLIEDNIITEAFPCIEMNQGSTGNVFAYNFIHNENGEMALNVNHGPHNVLNLVEGNVVTNVNSDGLFGGESETTYFRNLIHGNGINCIEGGGACIGGRGTETDTQSWVFALKRFTRDSTVVGNVLGAFGVHTSGVFSLGDPNLGNSYSLGTAQWSLGDYWADWNASGSPHTVTLSGRTKGVVQTIYQFNVVSSGASTVTLEDVDGVSDTTSAYVNYNIVIEAGTGTGQERRITAYNGTTKLVTVDSAWVTPPDATSDYSIYAVTRGVMSGISTMAIMENWETNAAGPLGSDIWITSADGSIVYGSYDVTAYDATSLTVQEINAVTFPPDGTALLVVSGYGGFQELDLDVDATLIRTDNYIGTTQAIDTVSGFTVPDSLFRASAPAFFNSLSWPPVDATSPVYDYEIIPAGYRFLNGGSDPP